MIAIQKVLDGEVEAFAPLVSHFQARVMHAAAAITGDVVAAQDLAQDAFVSAFQHLKNYDADCATFSTWLYAIVRNRSRNFLRQKKAKPSSSAEDFYQVCTNPRPDAALGWKDEMGVLDTALMELPESWRRAFSLTEIEGLSYADAAMMEGVPIGTIRSRVHRSRKFLAGALINPFNSDETE